jgi:ATP-binding cassette, subfamily B, bacterial
VLGGKEPGRRGSPPHPDDPPPDGASDPLTPEGDGAAAAVVPPFVTDGGSPRRGVRFLQLPGQVARALRFVWQAGRREMTTILALQVVSGVAIAAQLLLGRAILEAVLREEGSRLGVNAVVPELLGLAVTTLAASFAASGLLESQRLLAELVARHTVNRLIEVTSSVELEAFEVPEFYDRLERSKANAGQRTYELATGVIALGAGITGLFALLTVMFAIGLPFLPLVLLAYAPLWVATARNGRASYEFTFWATPADRERDYLQQVLTGKAEAKEVRLFGLAPVLRRRHGALYDQRLAELRRVAKRRLQRSVVANLVSTAIVLSAAAILIQLAANGSISAADAGVAIVATVQLGTRLRFLGTGVGSISECSLFLSDFEAFLRLKDAWAGLAAAASPVPAAPFDHIATERVTFAYPGTGRPVLTDVTVDVRRGEMIALVGRNGSGKSTLAKVLCGLYRPDAGRVLLNGVDAQSLPPEEVRRSIAAVFQDFVCYQLPARDNIGVGNTAQFDDLFGIRQAAADAGIDGALAGLPDGYATILSRAFVGGADLSIGQWQRVALARAFFRDAPLVILDEPAAALDAEAEHELFSYIRRLRDGRAALVISHRLSTVREADRIYVLDRGAVVEAGTHDELITAGGPYAELFSLQAAGYVRDGDLL